jgi:hypothetical protein
MDAACDILFTGYRDDHLGLAGWFSVRFVGQSRAYLSQFSRSARTCTMEFVGLEQLSHTRILLARLEAAGRQHGGIQHWGMFDDLTEADVRRAYPNFDQWLGFSERCGLATATPPTPVEMIRSGNSIALVRQTPGWNTIPIAFANADGSWNVTNGAAPQFIGDWASQPGVTVIAGDFNGNGRTDIALVRQTPGWGTIPIAFSNGDGSWRISNGVAPQFIDSWAFQPGVRVVAGDFDGNVLC